MWPTFHIDWTFNIGQIVIAGLLGGIGWGIRKSYFMVKSFVKRQNDNENDLHRGLKMIDTHSFHLRRQNLVPGPMPRVFRRRATDYADVDILDDHDHL